MSRCIQDPLSFPDTRLFDSKWVKIETGRGVTTLTLPNLSKDDEGLYTLRMVTKGGTAEHSAFVSVSGERCWMTGHSQIVNLKSNSIPGLYLLLPCFQQFYRTITIVI